MAYLGMRTDAGGKPDAGICTAGLLRGGGRVTRQGKKPELREARRSWKEEANTSSGRRSR